MRRADRLFQLVQLLRKNRLITARHLSERLEVSERTVYRDIRDLVLSGVPIRGEAGVGYCLLQGFDLPPLMFSEEEIEALVLGVRIAQHSGDLDLRHEANSALAKIEAVLPERLRTRMAQSSLFAPPLGPLARGPGLTELRRAVRMCRKICFAYSDAGGSHSERRVRPLAVAFWGKVWTLAGYCEVRNAFRSFRLDRISRLIVSDEVFTLEPGKTLDDFIREVASRPSR